MWRCHFVKIPMTGCLDNTLFANVLDRQRLRVGAGNGLVYGEVQMWLIGTAGIAGTPDKLTAFNGLSRFGQYPLILQMDIFSGGSVGMLNRDVIRRQSTTRSGIKVSLIVFNIDNDAFACGMYRATVRHIKVDGIAL